MTPRAKSSSAAAVTGPSPLELLWLDAALRALIIPFDPAVARIEADVWGEWAENADDATDRIVLGAAARLAREERTSEAVTPEASPDHGVGALTYPAASVELASSGVLEGYMQARQTVLFGPEDIPVARFEAGVRSPITVGGHAAAHRTVLLAAIERHAANVPVWRWLARWYGALSLASGRAIEDLNTFQWGQEAFSLTMQVGVNAPFIRAAWSVIDRIAAASVCYTKRSADFTRFTLTSLRGTGLPDPERAPLPARPGVMHSIPLTHGEMWNAVMSFRSPDRGPEMVPAPETRFRAFELEVELPEPVWAHMPTGQQALRTIHPDIPGEPRTPLKSVGPAPSSRRKNAAVNVLPADTPYGVIDILDDPPRYGSPFLGDVEVRDERRAKIRHIRTLPRL